MQKKLRNLNKSQAGFSLIEIIMSIGILAIVSIFIMQMYIKATSLKEMAFDKDYALSTAQTVLEVYKSRGPEREIWINTEAILNETAVINQLDDPNSYTVEYYYDRNWQPAKDKQDKGYTLRLIIENQTDSVLPGSLTRADVSVIRQHPYLLSYEDNMVLCNLQSSTYFPFLLSERILNQ